MERSVYQPCSFYGVYYVWAGALIGKRVMFGDFSLPPVGVTAVSCGSNVD